MSETVTKTWAAVRTNDRIIGHDGNTWRIAERGENGSLTMIQLDAAGNDTAGKVTGAPPAANPVKVFVTPEDAPPKTETEALANVAAEFPEATTATGRKLTEKDDAPADESGDGLGDEVARQAKAIGVLTGRVAALEVDLAKLRTGLRSAAQPPTA